MVTVLRILLVLALAAPCYGSTVAKQAPAGPKVQVEELLRHRSWAGVQLLDDCSQRPFIVGIAGGTGSGKTTLAEAIVSRLGPQTVLHIAHDSYYKDLSALPMAERSNQNFDHPDSLETDLLVQHLVELRSGQAVAVPTYDFTTHTRTLDWIRCAAKPVVVVEGILLFTDPRLRELLDLRIFVDTAADIRFIRRLRRDVEERGRDMDGVIEQYQKTVRPMHDMFVEPSKAFADMLIPNGVNEPALDLVVGHLQARIASLRN